MTQTLPSDIIPVNIGYAGRDAVVHVPKNEYFLAQEIFSQEEYALPQMRSHLGPLNVLDIGANVGLYTVYMKLTYPDSIIHCYEPAPAMLALCQTNTGALSGVTLHPHGLFNRDCDAELNIHPLNTGENSVKHSGATPAQSSIAWH